MYVCVRVCARDRAHARLYVRLCVCVSVRVCVRACVCVRVSAMNKVARWALSMYESRHQYDFVISHVRIHETCHTYVCTSHTTRTFDKTSSRTDGSRWKLGSWYLTNKLVMSHARTHVRVT